MGYKYVCDRCGITITKKEATLTGVNEFCKECKKQFLKWRDNK